LLLPRAAAADDRAADFFDDGMRFMAKKNYAKACASFEASFDEDPSLATLSQIGLCYEKWGKWAEAYRAFSKAASMARDKDDERFSKLRTQSERAGRKIARLTIRIPKDAGRVTVTLDGTPIERKALAEELVLEPGPHEIVAIPAGQAPVSEKIELERGARELRQLHVRRERGKTVAQWTSDAEPEPTAAAKPAPEQPAVDAAAQDTKHTKAAASEGPPDEAANQTEPAKPTEPATPTKPTKEVPKPAKLSPVPEPGLPARKQGRFVGGIGLSVGGAAAVGVASYIALGARSDYKAAFAMCPGGKCSSMDAFETTRDAKAKARTMTYVFAGGVALIGVGVYLVATSGTEPRDRATATLFFIDGGGGIAFGGPL
jgi:hypothetical protein